MQGLLDGLHAWITDHVWKDQAEEDSKKQEL